MSDGESKIPGWVIVVVPLVFVAAVILWMLGESAFAGATAGLGGLIAALGGPKVPPRDSAQRRADGALSDLERAERLITVLEDDSGKPLVERREDVSDMDTDEKVALGERLLAPEIDPDDEHDGGGMLDPNTGGEL